MSAPIPAPPSWVPPVETTTPMAFPPAPSGDDVRGGRWLRKLEFAGHALDRLVHRMLPPESNPFSQIGAVANTCLLIALASGILLLFWYSPSVHQAWQSLESMRAGSFLGSLARSVHRYSSDACVLFVLLHAVRMFLARRFAGPRWLAWATGVALLALVWAIGWSGYWLVWDVRAQHAALGSAKFVDRLPVLAEPMSRSFVTNESVPSLLFFVIFFSHMLGPLGLGIGLWIHLQRVNRARLLAPRTLALWITGSLVVLSVLAPATSAPAADMLARTERFSMDWWYLWPLVLTDRLGGGLLWLLFLGAGTVVTAIPWWLVRKPRPVPATGPSPAPRAASVDLKRCFGCTLCAKDCPFNAITMVPRADDRNFTVQSLVDPDLCVACGVCVGSCDSEAIELAPFATRDLARTLRHWIESDAAAGKPSFAALLCAGSAGGALRSDAQGRCDALPGYRTMQVPCVGWISAVLLERTLEHGALGVLVAGCPEGDPNCREGTRWFRQRLEGTREPSFDPRKADRSRVRFVQHDAAQPGRLVAAAAAFRAGTAPTAPFVPSAPRRWLGALALATVLCGTTWVGSRLPYRTQHDADPVLVVSFNHGGERLSQHAMSPEEAAKRLPHMRSKANLTRERVPVRIRVTVDGKIVHEASHAPKGLSHDGPSLALERFPVAAGTHGVAVELGDAAGKEFNRRWAGNLEFTNNRIRAVLFDTKSGFTVH